jgi:ATP-dependent Lon protease
MSEIKTARRRRTKSGEAAPPPPPDQKSPKKKNRYPLRSKDKPIESVRWVDDDTLFDDEEDSDFEDESEPETTKTTAKSKLTPKLALKLDEEEEEEEEEEDQIIHGIKVPSNMPVSVKIHLHAHVDAEAEYDDEDEDDDDDEDGYGEDEDEDDDEIPHAFIQSLFSSKLKNHPMFIISGDEEKENKKEKKSDKDEPAIRLSRRESDYFQGLTKQAKKGALKKMKTVSDLLGESEIPYKFRVLDIDMPPKVQCEIIRKVDAMNRMGSENGESQKLRNWIDGVLRVPFGKNVPLPVTIKDGPEKCSLFLKDARTKMDKATYGMLSAKTQILQVLAQWISNPTSVGNVIAMRGPMGVGKTSFARNGIAEVLGRPFIFTSLGGASDIAHYSGHSYTYEGSMWGRIVDSIIQAGCMNPVLYFDELDKVSGTPHGEEIISMLIHLTDRSQNSQYHDRYFAGIDFDLSQCLFVFSFNDEERVHPVLKDRMRVINIPGYKDAEKKVIVANYIWPDILRHAGISREDLSADEEAAEYIIKEYSNNEAGMRNLIRVVEAVVARVNLIRISDEESAKAYKFWIPVTFPMKLTRKMVETVLTDFNTTLPEHWRSLYT